MEERTEDLLTKAFADHYKLGIKHVFEHMDDIFEHEEAASENEREILKWFIEQVKERFESVLDEKVGSDAKFSQDRKSLYG